MEYFLFGPHGGQHVRPFLRLFLLQNTHKLFFKRLNQTLWLLPWYWTYHFHFSCGHILHSSSLLKLLTLLSWQESYSPVCCLLYLFPSALTVHILLMSQLLWMETGWLLCFLYCMSLFLLLCFQKYCNSSVIVLM